MKLLFIQNWIADETLKVLGWTLFHSLWIGLLAAVVSGIIIITTRKSIARLRYNLLTGVLFLFLISCICTFFIQNQLPKVVIAELQETTTDSLNPTVSSGEYALTASKNFVDEFTQYFNTNAALFILLWSIFFIIHCIKLLTGIAGVNRLRNHRTSLPDEEWILKLKNLGNKLNVSQSVILLQSELIKVPVVIGFLKPVILVPVGLLSNLPPGQVEAILLHELAHIRRKDYLINLVQRFAEAIFFFNPAFIWLNSLIRQEREACCDDVVVTTTGQKRNYLEALVSFQEYSVISSQYAMSIRSKQYYLLNRVKRLLTRENKKLNAMEKFLLLFGLIVFTAFTTIPQKEKSKKPLTINSGKIDPSVETKIQIVKPESKPVRQIRDTVPPKVKISNENDFKQISTNVNIEGNTKKETITAFDAAGKKYNMVRLNDKLTSLQVDDKTIPESEFGNYTSVINQIDEAREKSRQRKLKQMEARKAEYEKKKIEHENKKKEKSKMIDEKMKDKIGAIDKKSEEVIKKKIEARRKDLDADRKILDKKKKEISDVKNEIAIKRKELKTKEPNEKEIIEKQIRLKEKMMENKYKEMEDRKKIMGDKKDEIGKEKEKLEKIKEKEKEKEHKSKELIKKRKNDVSNSSDSKEILRESTIALKREISHTIDINTPEKKSFNYKNEVYAKAEREPRLKNKENKFLLKPKLPTASNWLKSPSRPLFEKTEKKVNKSENRNSPERTSIKRV